MQGIDWIRHQVRTRDNHICQKCRKEWKKGRRFDVHHLDPSMESKKDYSYDRNNQDKLITLCHKCHFNEPHILKKFSRINLERKHNVSAETRQKMHLAKIDPYAREKQRIVMERLWAKKKGLVYNYG